MAGTLKSEEVVHVINKAKKDSEVIVSIHDDHRDVFKVKEVVDAITRALGRGAEFTVIMGPVDKIEDCSGLSLLKPYTRTAAESPVCSFIVVDKGRSIVLEDR